MWTTLRIDLSSGAGLPELLECELPMTRLDSGVVGVGGNCSRRSGAGT